MSFTRRILRGLGVLGVCMLALGAAAQDTPPTLAAVDTVKVIYNTTGSVAPIQIDVSGTLADGCTRLDTVTQTQEKAELKLTITTERSTDALCTQALEPFDETYDIDMTKLRAGDYLLNVNGVTATLTVTQAMLRAASTDLAAAPAACQVGDRMATQQYYNPDANFCFIYPASATITEDDGTLIIDLFGVNGIPTELTLSYEAADGRTLKAVAAEFAVKNPDAELMEGLIGIYPAQIATGVGEDADELFATFIADDTLFTVTNAPLDTVLWGMISQTFIVPSTISVPDNSITAENLPEECPLPTEDTNAYYSELGYFCMLVPLGYLARNQESAVLISAPDNDGDGSAPLLVVAAIPAIDQSLENAVLAIQKQNPQLEFEDDLTIAELPAVMTDDLNTGTGSQLVLTLADNWLYQFVLTPIDDRYEDETEAAQALWETVSASFTILPRPQRAPTTEAQLLMNAALGYGFLYPGNYEVTELEAGSIILAGPLDAPLEEQKRYSIIVIPSEGQTLDELLAEVRVQNASVNLKFEETEVAGLRFVYSDEFPTPLPSRQGFMQVDDNFLVFSLVPYDAELWEQLVGTFKFLAIEQDAGD